MILILVIHFPLDKIYNETKHAVVCLIYVTLWLIKETSSKNLVWAGMPSPTSIAETWEFLMRENLRKQKVERNYILVSIYQQRFSSVKF